MLSSRGNRYNAMDMKSFLRDVGRYVKIRSVRRAVVGGFLALVVLLVLNSTRRPRATSAVGCKNRLAEIIVPKQEERKKYLEGMGVDVFDLEDRFFSFVTSAERMCYDQVHLGPSEDGGWDVCLDPRYSIKKPCLVYSFGIGDDFRFEKRIEELLGCDVHAFDPSMGIDSHQYSAKGFFHNIGIDNVDSYAVGNTWKMRKLSTIMKMLKHEGRNIDYLKMDIEFSEWPALYEIINSGLINQVRQLAMEVHTPEVDIHQQPNNRCTWSTRDSLAAMIKILQDLHRAGFSLYHSRTNYRTLFRSGLTGKERYCCYDIHMVNNKHPLNAWRPV